MPEAAPLLSVSDKKSPEPHHPRRRRALKALAVIAAIGLSGAVALVGVAAYYANKYDNNVARIEGVFANIPESTRPAKATGKGQNFLLVGSDTRASGSTTGSDANSSGVGLTDTLMIVHLAVDRRSASVISIPRDSWVDIPGNGKGKINVAHVYGGPSLLVQTVEELTKIRIDHYLVVDFAGFAAMTDAVGGVDISVPAPFYDPGTGARWRAGPQHMDGRTALLFVRQRHGLPNADMDRIDHQHLFLAALMAKATSGARLAKPRTLARLLDAVTRSVSVDSGLSAGGLRSVALSLRDLRGGAVQFLTVPVNRIGRVGKSSVMFPDYTQAEVLFHAVRTDALASYQPPPAFTDTFRVPLDCVSRRGQHRSETRVPTC